jgi:hypothetical protein
MEAWRQEASTTTRWARLGGGLELDEMLQRRLGWHGTPTYDKERRRHAHC